MIHSKQFETKGSADISLIFMDGTVVTSCRTTVQLQNKTEQSTEQEKKTLLVGTFKAAKFVSKRTFQHFK